MVDYKQLVEGSRIFVENEKRDAMYKVATYLVSQFWGRTRDITDGLGVLLLTWNQAFYRYGSFDFGSLENCLNENMTALSQFRERDIFSLDDKDEKAIRTLFDSLLKALQDPNGHNSPVAVSKTLHLLAPKFFPLWDNRIAKAYGCLWHYSNEAWVKYLDFMRKTQQLAEDVTQSFVIMEGGDEYTAVEKMPKMLYQFAFYQITAKNHRRIQLCKIYQELDQVNEVQSKTIVIASGVFAFVHRHGKTLIRKLLLFC